MKRRNKILLGVGISIAVIAVVVGGWLVWQFQFQWISLEDNVSDEIVVNETEGTVTMNVNGWIDIVYTLDEPAFYIASERVDMRDGVRLNNGRPYMRMRDVLNFSNGIDTAIDAIAATCPYDPVGLVINGLYGQGSDEENALIHYLLGNELARDRFELYFQWFNTVHELAHLITVHHGTYDSENMEGTRHMVYEEQLVNSFAGQGQDRGTVPLSCILGKGKRGGIVPVNDVPPGLSF